MIESGFVNIIKPTGMTSFAAAKKVKQILGVKKVGHLGTLDPAASGVLTIAVGKATKLFDYFLSKDKVYIARVLFGVETDTLDSYGKVILADDKQITLKLVQSVLSKFIGESLQTPPKYSAVNIKGKRAYDLARQGEEFEIKPKKINVYSIDVTSCANKNEFLFKVHCSSGTYIRTLMCDIAHEINSICTTFVIIRVKSGLFDIDTALTLAELEESKKIISIEDTFKNTKKVEVTKNIFKKLSNGVKISVEDLGINLEQGQTFFAVYEGRLIGMYKQINGKIEMIAYLLETGE